MISCGGIACKNRKIEWLTNIPYFNTTNVLYVLDIRGISCMQNEIHSTKTATLIMVATRLPPFYNVNGVSWYKRTSKARVATIAIMHLSNAAITTRRRAQRIFDDHCDCLFLSYKPYS